MTLLEVAHVCKNYQADENRVEALRGVSLTLSAGEFVALVGPSGCGKSTLLHLCGAMDRPTGGEVVFEGQSLATLEDERLTAVRRDRVGFVFQFFNLLPTLTVQQNIALPLLLAGLPSGEREQRALNTAARVGLSDRLTHFPQQLSGGEMQRVAVARAIVHRPALVIADEPTGNLDSESGAQVLALLAELQAEAGVTLLMATHDAEVARAADRLIQMRDGLIVADPVSRPALPIESGRGGR